MYVTIMIMKTIIYILLYQCNFCLILEKTFAKWRNHYKPLLCTIVNDSLIKANQKSGDVDIYPLFPDRRQKNTNGH